MTIIKDQDVACAVCGVTNRCFVLHSTGEFGSPDLDLRPSEMRRSTMWCWVQRCTACGYCAPHIARGIPGAVDTVRSASYQSQLLSAEYPDRANTFLCLALLYEQDGQLADAGWSAVHAAWVCDDAEAADSGRRCRLRADELLKEAVARGDVAATGTTDAVRIDLLRRAGTFDAALALCEHVLAPEQDETLQQVLRYQRDLIQRQDTGCNTVKQVVDR
jgi:hypothetical protein